MKYLFMAVFYAMLIAVMEVSAKGYYCTKHIVTKSGDKCSYIWDKDINKDYFLRRIDFLRINPAIDCDNLKPKTKICVDIDTRKTQSKNPYNEYTIKKGDTCKTIAKKTNSDIKTLLNVNTNILDCNNIQVGNEIEYHKDGDYTPDFSKSKEVSVYPKKVTTTSVKKTTKTTTKKVTKTTTKGSKKVTKIVKTITKVKTSTKKSVKSN